MTNFNFKPYTVNKGACLYHVFTQIYGPTGFNDSGKGVRRFDPIKDASGKIVSSFYAAYSDLVALQEVVLRLDDNNVHQLTWRKETEEQKQKKLVKGIAQVRTHRELLLVDLESVTYGKTNETLAVLLRQGNIAYVELREIAKFFVNNHTDYDGLIWDSYQRGTKGERSLVLWGHKVARKELKCDAKDMINTAGNLERLRDALRSLNVLVPDWLAK